MHIKDPSIMHTGSLESLRTLAIIINRLR